jgi:hypothetical protein
MRRAAPKREQRSVRELPSNAVAHWVGEIKAAFSNGRECALNLAKIVWTAKRKLHYGQWSALWRSGSLPFKKRKGEMLVVIWKGLGRLDAHTCSHLPSSWRTLYLLAQLDSKAVVDLVGQGKIHPRLTVQEARALLDQVEDGQRPRRPQVQRRLDSFRDFISSTLTDWTASERDEVPAELLQLAHELASSARIVQPKPLRSAFTLNDRHHPNIGSHSV